MQDKIIVRGAHEDVAVEMPCNSLVVITGLSGASKSSLNIATIYGRWRTAFCIMSPGTIMAHTPVWMGSQERRRAGAGGLEHAARRAELFEPEGLISSHPRHRSPRRFPGMKMPPSLSGAVSAYDGVFQAPSGRLRPTGVGVKIVRVWSATRRLVHQRR